MIDVGLMKKRYYPEDEGKIYIHLRGQCSSSRSTASITAIQTTSQTTFPKDQYRDGYHDDMGWRNLDLEFFTDTLHN
ncbi:hypothetical protein EYC84_011535 [Monilinia fructicola]|uniref:Uncharacterized protein n=1 Tax=Monilinia fructicola TaxID=38448 RepID=A0A5M9J5G5_MONFR|nr:hypothetical protein EYC84_011535 [Monilinia fructicola]